MRRATRWGARLGATSAALTVLACGRGARRPPEADAACATLDPRTCHRARGLAAAAPTYADGPHALLLLDPRVPTGRGVVRTSTGDGLGDPRCAEPTEHGDPRLDLRTIDAAFVGVAIDATLVASDADVAPLLASGDHELALVAIAVVHDAARGSIAPGRALVERSEGCACGAATHVAGETLYGASVAYRGRAPRVHAPTRAIDLAVRTLADPDAHVVESRVGSLVVDGIEPYLADRAARPLAFRVDRAAPVARALRGIEEACPDALAAPIVSPSPVDFGTAPYGAPVTRSVHVVNRTSRALEALLGARTVAVPARGAIDLPLTWTPDGDAWRCETQTRQEAIRFVPAAHGVSVVPREQMAMVLEVVRTGRASIARAERIEPSPTDKAGAPLTRDWACLPDFAPSACTVDRATGDARAVKGDHGCRFECAGPAATCRFDARMECALRCPE